MQIFHDFNKTVSDIVREDYRTSDVFKKYGVNYCCDGKLTLLQACTDRNLDCNAIINELTDATRNIYISNALQFSQWKLDFLIDYIVNVHHAYQKIAIPSIEATLISVAGDGNNPPELNGILELFQKLVKVILPQNLHEEEIVFPYIKQMENAHRRKETYGRLFVRTLRKPLSHFENENAEITDLVKQIQSYTNNYKFPIQACTNYQILFHKLFEFHQDMVQHKHLENNILLPRAVELEKELLQL